MAAKGKRDFCGEINVMIYMFSYIELSDLVNQI